MAGPKRQAAGDETSQSIRKRNKAVTVVSTRTTRSTSRASHLVNREGAINAVFLTTELLENVLESLPMRDLLLAQRVSRKWKAVITQSTPLQQTLYLAPRPPDFCWELDPHSGLKWPQRVEPDHNLPRGSTDLVLLPNCQVNPMVFETVTDRPPGERCEDVFKDCLSGEVGALIEPHVRHQRPAMSFPQASWRRMLLTQPPIKSFRWEGENSALDGTSTGSLTRQGDLTCGKVVGKIGELYSADPFWMYIRAPDMLFSSLHDLAIMLDEHDVVISPEDAQDRRKVFRHRGWLRRREQLLWKYRQQRRGQHRRY